MPEQQKVIEVLDALERADWRHVGEVWHLVHPSDTRLLTLLAEECTRQLERVTEPGRRERLQLVRKRLLTTARLNEILPIETRVAGASRRATDVRAAKPYRKRRRRKATAASTVPGYEEYHQRVLDWLDKKGLSQQALARRLGVDPSYLSRAIRGRRPSRSLHHRIAELTGIPIPPIIWRRSDDDPPADLEPESAD